MKIYIARGDKQFGPYAREQLQTMLADGDVVPTDLAWHEGMEQWAPLSEMPGVIPAPKLPPILAPPILASYKPSIGGSGKPPIKSQEPPKANPEPFVDPNALNLRTEREKILGLILAKEIKDYGEEAKLLEEEQATIEGAEKARLQVEEEARVKPEPEPKPVESATVDVVITGSGVSTYDTQKVLQELKPDTKSYDLYKLLRDFPQTIAENVPVEKANEYKNRFENAGCTVELHPWTGPSEQPKITEPTPEPEPASVTSATMDVVITGCGMSTYNANKLLQELKPGVGYFDVSKLLRDFPQVAMENLPPKEAEAIKARLEAAGCTVELRPHSL